LPVFGKHRYTGNGEHAVWVTPQKDACYGRTPPDSARYTLALWRSGQPATIAAGDGSVESPAAAFINGITDECADV